MLTQILVAVLVVGVALMVTRDLAKTKTEILPGLPDGSGYDLSPRTRADRAGPFSQDYPGAGVPAGRDAGPFRRPDGSGPPPGDYQFPQAAPEQRPAGSHVAPSGTGNRYVRSRLRLLVFIPAVAVAAVAACVAGLVVVLQGGGNNAAGSSISGTDLLLAIVLGIVIVVVVVIAARTSTATARSVLHPLYGVRARALAMAGGQLSDATPLDTAAPDEIGDIARALEQLRAEMARLAGNDSGLRGKLESMFVNLSHRGQSLVERQMRLIESLEQAEQDRERRGMLFRMGRIAARMYHDSQNLLVLAGHDLNSGWNQPMPLANVIRAAIAEIEESERISVHAQLEIALAGPAVNDVVHLLAELIQNATSFSAVDMPVEISGQILNSGGVLISITDRGVGMSAQEMTRANWRLENPPAEDIDVPRWIGHFVVARLAARRGVRVRLQQAEAGGLTVLVWLPDEILIRQGAAMPQGSAGLGGAGPRRGMHEAATEAGGVTGQRGMPFGRRLAPVAGRLPGPAGASAPASTEVGAPHSAVGGASPPPVFQAPHVRTAQFTPAPPSAVAPQQEAGTDAPVIVPQTGNPAEERRLPIFDSVESNWFSGGRRTPGSSSTAAPAGNRWSSPADEEWRRTAQTAESPVAGAPTAAGLPQRLPNANLLPGAIPDAKPAVAPQLPSRSPAEARDRLGRLQRGVTEGRAASGEGPRPAGEDEA